MMCARRLVHRVLNRRTVAVIQKHIVGRGKRTIFRQLFHAKDDGKLVAAWRLDLDQIRLVFEVRQKCTSVRRLLTFPF